MPRRWRWTERGTLVGRAGKRRAFTVLELMVVVVVLAIIAALLLPAVLSKPRAHSGMPCSAILKLIGIDFRLWSEDNNNRFPMQSLTNAAGGPQFADGTNWFRYFVVMSNELSTPQVLHCPADTGRPAATNFASNFGIANISYFLGLDAEAARPNMWLAGDRNLKASLPVKNGLLTLSSNSPMDWTKAIHQNYGNVLFADGSVRGMSGTELGTALAATGTNVIRLLMP